jgi:phosphatidylserine/phosphatidylglycerophosphate/cardiolipin synthase-like enzyme
MRICSAVLLIIFLAASSAWGAQSPERKAHLFLGPKERGAPDDLEKELLKFIRGAKHSLEIMVHELDNENVTNALIEVTRSSRPNSTKFVKVRVITELNYLIDHGSRASYEKNRQLLNKLWRSGIDARPDYNPALFHHKFIVRDYNRAGEAVWTGSVNFTDSCLHVNYNNAVVIENHRLARMFRDEFNEAFQGAFGTRSIKHNPKPPLLSVDDDTKAQVFFTPGDDAQSAYISLIAKAKKSLNFLIFTFSERSPLMKAITEAAKRGVKVRGLCDRGQAHQKWSACARLAASGIPVSTHKGRGKVHHKVLIADESIFTTGSFNFTPAANEKNDENAVILYNTQLARRMNKEFERLFKSGKAIASKKIAKK